MQENQSIRWRRWFNYLQKNNFHQIIEEFHELIKTDKPKPYDVDLYKEALDKLGIKFIKKD